jgi:hypothetical protein
MLLAITITFFFLSFLPPISAELDQQTGFDTLEKPHFFNTWFQTSSNNCGKYPAFRHQR